MTDRQLIEAGDSVVAAVSGGADSVAMLCVLVELKSQMGFELSACHLNHQLRGKEADGDEAYVRELCEKWKVPIYAERQDVKAIQKREGGSLEETARRVRYDFFERAAKNFHANKIALAHHRDDQCETVIFNLIRGSSIHGIRGIPVSRALHRKSVKSEKGVKGGEEGHDIGEVKLIRPMLGAPKAELEKFLRDKNIPWREDRTNFELEASRNIIRHKVLPAMAEVSESVRDHLVLLAEQAAEIETMLTEQAETILRACVEDKESIRIETWRLSTLPKLVASETVRLMLMRVGAGLADFTAEHFYRIAGLTKRRMNLPGGYTARQEHGWLIIGRFEANHENNIGQVESLPINGRCTFGRFAFSAEVREFDSSIFKDFLRSKSRYEEYIDADKLRGGLQVRCAREGERFCPLGSPGSKKVGDFLTDVKAGFAARPAVVVADNDGIVWLVGWRPAERVRVSEGTRRLLLIRRLDWRQG